MKRMFYLFMGLLLILSSGLTACGGSPAQTETTQASVDSTAASTKDGSTQSLAGNPVHGQEIFGLTCAPCHGPAGQGVPGLGRDMAVSDFIAAQTEAELAAFIKQGRPSDDPLNTTGVAMPPNGGNPSLSDQDLYDLAAYIRSLQQQESAAPKIEVVEPWSRPSPRQAGNGAVYLKLVNQGGSADVLLSAETEVAEVVELHETKMEGEVMKMSPLSYIEVPAGGSVSLEPGGKHIMLINLKQELNPGQKISLTLNFEQSGPLAVEVEVREK